MGALNGPPGPTSNLDSAGTCLGHISAQAACSGPLIAACLLDKQLTYSQLEIQSNRLARHLKNFGVGAEAVVAVCLERSLEALITFLAVWKAGGAYLPLDPQYPTDRLTFMLQDSRAQLLITQSRWRDQLPCPPRGTLCLDVPHERALWEKLAGTALPGGPTPVDLAYVIYTSGSTGQPKGVEITHASLVNHNLAMARLYQLGPGDRVLQFAPLSFDVSLEEIFPSWVTGATVVLRTEQALSSMSSFMDFLAAQRISVVNLPTAFWHELVEQLPQLVLPSCLRLVIIGGEKASETIYQKWRAMVPERLKLINAYGPTEATITATAFEAASAPQEQTLPIGRPIEGTEAWILDELLRPVPPGTVGQLFLGGMCLARGYRGRPELTAERFIRNPNADSTAAGRLYVTGDLVRQRADGNLEFIGRVDEQIKLRGFRIEPGEIEAAMRAFPTVAQAVVVARAENREHRRLVAYYIARPGHTVAEPELVKFLRDKLPAYMVPTTLVPLERLPLTPAGKVDRKALPEPAQGGAEPQNRASLPRTPTQQRLVDIWREVLQLERIGTQDSFLELGGDSLSAMRVAARIRETFGREPELALLLERGTIEALAAELDSSGPGVRHEPSPTPELRPMPRTGKRLASFSQEQLWLLHQLDPASDAYHVGVAFRLKGSLNPGTLEEALNQLVRRHELLRTGLIYDDGELVQWVAPFHHVPLSQLTLANVSRRQREAQLSRQLQAVFGRPFALDEPPLLRMVLLHLGKQEYIIILVLHHAITDGWSLALFTQQLERWYNTLSEGSHCAEPSGACLQYADFADWQRRCMQGERLQKQLQYWKQALAGAAGRINFPPQQLGSPAAKEQIPEVPRKSMKLPPATIDAAERFSRGHGVTPFMLLLGALGLTLYKWTSQQDLVVGTVVGGRSRREVEEMLGCFINFLPLRIRVDPAETGALLLDEVRTRVLQAQAHQDCPFKQLVQAVNPQRDQGNPLYNVALLWHNYTPPRFQPAGVSSQLLPLHPHRALLDLRFEAENRGGQWSIDCEYNPNLFTGPAVVEQLSSFARALEFLIHTPNRLLADFSPTLLLAPASRRWRSPVGWLRRALMRNAALQTEHG